MINTGWCLLRMETPINFSRVQLSSYHLPKFTFSYKPLEKHSVRLYLLSICWLLRCSISDCHGYSVQQLCIPAVTRCDVGWVGWAQSKEDQARTFCSHYPALGGLHIARPLSVQRVVAYMKEQMGQHGAVPKDGLKSMGLWI